MPYSSELLPLEGPVRVAVDTSLGCHLQILSSVGGCFSYGNGAREFDKLMKRNHGEGIYAGGYFNATLVTIHEESGAKTFEELKKRGFKLLGTSKGGHGDYKMQLWGEGFTPPEEK